MASGVSLSAAGHWLTRASHPPEPEPALVTVQPDFTLLVPAGVALLDRFRVACFHHLAGGHLGRGPAHLQLPHLQMACSAWRSRASTRPVVLAFLQARAAAARQRGQGAGAEGKGVMKDEG